jgi:hypothetical protein
MTGISSSLRGELRSFGASLLPLSQLIQLLQAREKFQQQGLRLAAVSYDSEAIMQDCIRRHKVEYPLIAHPKSEVIWSYCALNPDVPGFRHNMTYPRYFYVARKEEKLFKAAHTDRDSGKGALLKLFTDAVEGSDRDVAASNIKVTILQSDEEVGPGKLSCGLGRGFPSSRTHVYASRVRGYKPIQSTMEGLQDLRLPPPRYPNPKSCFFRSLEGVSTGIRK